MKTQTALEPEPRGAEGTGLFQRVNRIYESIARRAYELFEHRGANHGNDLSDWLTAESELLIPVQVDITQDEKQITVKTEVPGFAKSNLGVAVDGNRLLISGARNKSEQNTKADVHFSSESSEEFLRVLDLPAAVDASKTEARFDHDTLRITLPKGEETAWSHTEIKVQ